MTESIFRSCIIGCITACTLLFLANCSPDDGGKIDDGKTDDGETDEPSTDDSSRRPPFDAVTSATPDVAQAELDPTHPGWMQAGCATCHDSTHVGNYVVPDCVFCHGRNGAPDRVAPHADNNCRDCHGDSHGDIELASPETCRTCHHYQKSASCGNTETLDVVVIGAGGGGLAAAAALARAGKKIVLLERQYKLGGQMGIIRRGPYNIELSLHSMSGLTEGMIPAEMFEQLGIWDTLKPVTLDPLFRIVSSDSDASVPADYQTDLDVLQKEFPEEAENLARLFEDLSGLSVLIEAAMVFQSTGEMPSHVTPEDLMELEKLLNTSVSDFVYGYIENTRLFGVVTSLTVYMGKLPQEMSALTFVAIWKGFQLDGLQYLEGGSETIINALADIIRENGNTIELQTEATKILIDEEGKATQVQTQDGRCFNTRHVVSNANAPATLFEMVGEEHLPDDYVKRVKEMEQSPSMFVIYLGVDRDYVPEFGGGHELFMGEHADNDVTLENILECRVDEVGFAMTNYSAVDPKAAPLGKNAITIITMLPFECFDNWQWDTSHEAYRKQKAEVAEIILSKAETILPDLMSHIEVMEIATPQTIRAYTLNPRGSILGWADTLEQNILTRLEQQTPIPNLWLAGAWTNPGGGQQYVLSSGLTAAKSVIEALKETP